MGQAAGVVLADGSLPGLNFFVLYLAMPALFFRLVAATPLAMPRPGPSS